LNDANLIKVKPKAKNKKTNSNNSQIISRSTTKTDLIYQWINFNKTITLERKNNRAHRHRSKRIWGAQDILIQLRNITQNLKLLPRNYFKGIWRKKKLDEFENRFQRLMLHFTRYNNIDNVIERVILGENQDEKTLINDKILVHGVGGKIIKATPNQQVLVDK
jgi:hypothetical protein